MTHRWTVSGHELEIDTTFRDLTIYGPEYRDMDNWRVRDSVSINLNEELANDLKGVLQSICDEFEKNRT